jgi:hypothetical protein
VLTYDTFRESGLILNGETDEMPRRLEPVQLQNVGSLPDVFKSWSGYPANLIIPSGADSWVAYPGGKRGVPLWETDIIFNCVDSESASPSMGQIGLLQEHRRSLKIVARSLYSDLQSLDSLMGLPNTMGAVGAGSVAEKLNLQGSDQRNVCSYSFYQPYAPTTYYLSIQDELLTYVVSVFVDARTYLQRALNIFQDRIRLLSVVIAILRAAAFTANIFCSVRWEKRRWFLFHGARPPKSTLQALWACMPEACSGSALA